MPVNALTGQDTCQIAGRTFSDFGDGDVVKLSYPNELVGVKTGKNGNTIYNLNATGQQVDVILRILRGSADDRFLNALQTTMLADLPAFVLMPGYFVKRIGNGIGGVRKDTYLLSGGVFTKGVEAAENVDGATDPAISIYTLKFGNGTRASL